MYLKYALFSLNIKDIPAENPFKMEKRAETMSEYDPGENDRTLSDAGSDAETDISALNESMDKELSEYESPKASPIPAELTEGAARAHFSAQNDALRAQVSQGGAQLAQKTQEAQDLQKHVDESLEEIKLLKEAAREKEAAMQQLLAELEDSKKKYLFLF